MFLGSAPGRRARVLGRLSARQAPPPPLRPPPRRPAPAPQNATRPRRRAATGGLPPHPHVPPPLREFWRGGRPFFLGGRGCIGVHPIGVEKTKKCFPSKYDRIGAMGGPGGVGGEKKAAPAAPLPPPLEGPPPPAMIA